MRPGSAAEARQIQRRLFDAEFRGVSGHSGTGHYLEANRPVWRRRGMLARRYLSAHARVLDVGCGDGSIAAFVAPDCLAYLGIDVSPAGIERARRRLCAPHIRFEVKAVEELIRAEPLDAILAYEVIEHLYDPLALLRRAYHLLRPGGLLFVSTPNVERLTNRIRRVTRWLRGLEPRPPLISSHFVEVTSAGLDRLIREAGLRILARADDILFDAKFLPAWAWLQALNVRLGALVPGLASALVRVAERPAGQEARDQPGDEPADETDQE